MTSRSLYLGCECESLTDTVCGSIFSDDLCLEFQRILLVSLVAVHGCLIRTLLFATRVSMFVARQLADVASASACRPPCGDGRCV